MMNENFANELLEVVNQYAPKYGGKGLDFECSLISVDGEDKTIVIDGRKAYQYRLYGIDNENRMMSSFVYFLLHEEDFETITPRDMAFMCLGVVGEDRQRKLQGVSK